jgi:hypothetical protein
MTLSLCMLLFGFSIFFISACIQFYCIIHRANTDDLSEGKGPVLPAFLYSLTIGMSPVKKETAFLHLPTYVAGIIYHLGSFYSLLLIVFHIIMFDLPVWITQISIFVLFGTSLCGLGIFIKRLFMKKMRHISTPDDYFSNILVTGFQLFSAFSLQYSDLTPYLYIYTGFLFLYLPIGKLRHVIFFVIARFYLALFYGKRGVWPQKNRKKWQI